MHSHFLKKFLKETLHFSGCWLFLKKWNNESPGILLPNIIITLPIQVYPPKNVRKNFVFTKFWQIFKLSPPIIMRGTETKLICAKLQTLDMFQTKDIKQSKVFHFMPFWLLINFEIPAIQTTDSSFEKIEGTFLAWCQRPTETGKVNLTWSSH